MTCWDFTLTFGTLSDHTSQHPPFHAHITMTSSKSISKRMEQPHIPGMGSNYRTPVKLGTRLQKEWVSVPLLGQELQRHELLKCKDTFDTKDRAKLNQSQDDANNWQDIIETDDICVYQIPSPPPYNQQYSKHILNQGPWVPKKHNLREDMMHQYNIWKMLIPTLVKLMLAFLSKTSGKPLSVDISMPLCNQCDREKTSPVLCLFWDHR